MNLAALLAARGTLTGGKPSPNPFGFPQAECKSGNFPAWFPLVVPGVPPPRAEPEATPAASIGTAPKRPWLSFCIVALGLGSLSSAVCWICWMDIRDKKACYERGKIQRANEQVEHRQALDHLAARETGAHANPKLKLAVARLPAVHPLPPALPMPSVQIPVVFKAGAAAQPKPITIAHAALMPKTQPSLPKQALRVVRAIPSRKKKGTRRSAVLYATVFSAKRTVRPQSAPRNIRVVRRALSSPRPPTLAQVGMRKRLG
jgi:hypothetical protein